MECQTNEQSTPADLVGSPREEVARNRPIFVPSGVSRTRADQRCREVKSRPTRWQRPQAVEFAGPPIPRALRRHVCQCQ